MDDRAPGRGEKDLTDRIAMGATGVALTAGAVAAGALLMKRQNREMLGKRVTQTTSALSSALAKIPKSVTRTPRMMQGAIAHQLKRAQGTSPRRRSSKR